MKVRFCLINEHMISQNIINLKWFGMANLYMSSSQDNLSQRYKNRVGNGIRQ